MSSDDVFYCHEGRKKMELDNLLSSALPELQILFV